MSVQVETGRASSLPWGLITSDPKLIARVSGGLADVEVLLERAGGGAALAAAPARSTLTTAVALPPLTVTSGSASP